MTKRSIVIPHEHGGWAMVSVPFLFGMLAGEPQRMHGLLFLAWLLIYLSSYPLLQAVKRTANRGRWLRWSAGYGAAAIACLIPLLLQQPALFYFALPLLALLAVNLWHAGRKSERAIMNDLCAILAFSIGGAAAYLVGGGGWDQTMAAVVLLCFLYFTGSAFFVKSVFRERTNRRWMLGARIYHAVMLAVPWAAGYPWLTLAYVFPAVRAFAYAGASLRPWKAGIIEIAGALQFLLISALLIR